MSTPAAASPGLYAREPYRLLFPLGLAYVVLGLGLWLAGSQLQVVAMPTLLHMALMVVGLVGAISCGFLLTMLPNLLQTAPASWAWTGSAVGLGLLGLLSLGLGFIGSHGLLMGAYALLILAFAATRLPRAQRKPPARMLLAVLGLLAAVASGVLVLATQLGLNLPVWVGGTIHDLGNQGILLLLIGAIAGFLLPRLALSGRADPECLAPLPGPAWHYVGFALLGLIIIASYAGQRWVLHLGEGFGSSWHYAWALLRALLFTALLAPCLWLRGKQPAYLRCAQSAIYSLLIGLWGAAVHPQLAISWLHLVFVGGFLLLTLIIAARVISAHAGMSELLDRGGRWVITLTVLIHTASLSRMGAEWAPKSYDTHLILGSAFALLALGQWAWRYGPLLLRGPASQTEGC